MPLTFEPNQGQADPHVQFVARANGFSLLLASGEAVVALDASASQPTRSNVSLFHRDRFAPSPAAAHSARNSHRDAIRIRLIGANPLARVAGLDPLPSHSNYFIGNNPAAWRTNIPNYARVQYRGLYPGIDLVFYGGRHRLEHDFLVAPGANPGRIGLAFEGARGIAIDAGGNLTLSAAANVLRIEKPRAYQETSHGRREIAARFVLQDDSRVRFALAPYDTRLPLVIDPILDYSTYFGGSGDDIGNAIALDSSGNAYVAGETASADLPTTNLGYQTSFAGGSEDAFVAKFDTTKSGAASLIYSTYVGGNDQDQAFGVAVDKTSGDVYIAGDTKSTNFPAKNAYNSSLSGPGTYDAFLTKLDSTGSTLLYSTYLGSTADEAAYALSADSSGHAYITGVTNGSFPTTATAYQQTIPGNGVYVVAFLSKFDTNASGPSSLVYSTFLGGTNGETDGYAITADSAGHAWVTGATFASDFPTTANAFQPVIAPIISGSSGFDSLMTEFDTTKSGASSLVYSTYLGGGNEDDGYGIAIEPGCSSPCNVYVAGTTLSPNFPTSNAFQSGPKAGFQSFLTKFNSSGGVTYSTYFGGNPGNNAFDEAFAVAADSSGAAYITGRADSADFPVFRGFQTSSGGGKGDAFVAKFGATGRLDYSSYLGGNGIDRGFGIAVDSSASPKAYVTGFTQSSNLSVSTGAYQSQSKGGDDAFLVKVDDSASDFALEGADGSLTVAQTVSQGGTATYSLEVAAFSGFNGAVNLTCSGAPALTTCNIPASVNSTNYQFTVTITTTPRSGALPVAPSPQLPFLPLACFIAALAIASTLLLWRRAGSSRVIRVTAILFCLALFSVSYSACGGGGYGGGGGGGGGGGTIPGAYPVTITGSSGSANHTMSITLNVIRA